VKLCECEGSYYAIKEIDLKNNDLEDSLNMHDKTEKVDINVMHKIQHEVEINDQLSHQNIIKY